MLTEEQVRHVAKLARLELTDEEVKKFSGELSDILKYVELLEEVDTSEVKPTFQVTGLENVSEKDEVLENCSREDMLGTTSLPKERNQIRVKAVIS